MVFIIVSGVSGRGPRQAGAQELARAEREIPSKCPCHGNSHEVVLACVAAQFPKRRTRDRKVPSLIFLIQRGRLGLRPVPRYDGRDGVRAVVTLTLDHRRDDRLDVSRVAGGERGASKEVEIGSGRRVGERETVWY